MKLENPIIRTTCRLMSITDVTEFCYGRYVTNVTHFTMRKYMYGNKYTHPYFKSEKTLMHIELGHLSINCINFKDSCVTIRQAVVAVS